jgi:hypothetical protein
MRVPLATTPASKSLLLAQENPIRDHGIKKNPGKPGTRSVTPPPPPFPEFPVLSNKFYFAEQAALRSLSDISKSGVARVVCMRHRCTSGTAGNILRRITDIIRGGQTYTTLQIPWCGPRVQAGVAKTEGRRRRSEAKHRKKRYGALVLCQGARASPNGAHGPRGCAHLPRVASGTRGSTHLQLTVMVIVGAVGVGVGRPAHVSLNDR